MTAYDLSNYLCPDSARAYTLNSGELCQSLRQSSGYVRFLKNQHFETLWQDDQFIYRGLDTSGLPGEVYALYTGERYGSPWAARFMSVGDVFERHADVRHYDASGKLLRTDPNVVTYLKLAQHYTGIYFQETGQSVGDVLLFEQSFDAAMSNVYERYYFAKAIGLVGFDFTGQPPFASRFSGFTQIKPVYVPFPLNEPVPPPLAERVSTPAMPSITTAKPDNLGTPVPSKTTVPLKLHTAPNLASDSITIPVGAAVSVYTAPLVKADGYSFAYVTFLGNSGYAAVDAGVNHAPSFDPAMLLPAPAPSPSPTPTPAPEPTISIPLSTYNRFYAAWLALQAAGKELPPTPAGGGF